MFQVNLQIAASVQTAPSKAAHSSTLIRFKLSLKSTSNPVNSENLAINRPLVLSNILNLSPSHHNNLSHILARGLLNVNLDQVARKMVALSCIFLKILYLQLCQCHLRQISLLHLNRMSMFHHHKKKLSPRKLFMRRQTSYLK